MLNEERKYYVYTYSRPDGEVFYVGKGSGKRLFEHMKEISQPMFSKNNNVNYLKQSIIKKILRNGEYPIIQKVKENLSEEEAFKLESDLISFYGKIIDKSGTLANLTNGGEGRSGYKLSEETKQKISKAHIGKKKSDEHRRKLLGRKMSKETIQKITKYHKKPIKQLNLDGEIIAVWDCARSAVESFKERGVIIQQQNINRCCHGKTKTSCGFMWEFI